MAEMVCHKCGGSPLSKQKRTATLHKCTKCGAFSCNNHLKILSLGAACGACGSEKTIKVLPAGGIGGGASIDDDYKTGRGGTMGGAGNAGARQLPTGPSNIPTEQSRDTPTIQFNIKQLTDDADFQQEELVNEPETEEVADEIEQLPNNPLQVLANLDKVIQTPGEFEVNPFLINTINSFEEIDTNCSATMMKISTSSNKFEENLKKIKDTPQLFASLDILPFLQRADGELTLKYLLSQAPKILALYFPNLAPDYLVKAIKIADNLGKTLVIELPEYDEEEGVIAELLANISTNIALSAAPQTAELTDIIINNNLFIMTDNLTNLPDQNILLSKAKAAENLLNQENIMIYKQVNNNFLNIFYRNINN